MMRNKGFTLVEILIVVIILGILAAIVIPQFTEASNDARNSSLASDLQTLRSQVELYKIQHNDVQPGDSDADGVADDAALFVSQMTKKTDETGAVDTGTLGPYLQRFPSNPFVADTAAEPDKSRSVAIGVAVLDADTAGDGTTGWYFNTDTGKASANDTSTDHSRL